VNKKRPNKKEIIKISDFEKVKTARNRKKDFFQKKTINQEQSEAKEDQAK